MKRASSLVLRMLMVAVIGVSLFPAPAEADMVAAYPPYTRGRICYHHFWGTPSSFRTFCNNYPTRFGLVPSYNDPAAPFNSVAMSAWMGFLTVGGKEFLYLNSTTYLADVHEALANVEYSSPPMVYSTVTATAYIEDVYRFSSPYFQGLSICFRLVDFGPTSLLPAAGGTLGIPHCIDPNRTSLRTLQTSASIPPSRRFALEVKLVNAWNDGVADFRVYQMTCEGSCLPMAPPPQTYCSYGCGGGGY